jgi:C_GCAxxG_C_C family probable redox protein
MLRNVVLLYCPLTIARSADREDTMDKKQVEQRAFDLFQNGFNCAEAVSTAVVEWYGAESKDFTPKAATAFGGGVGGTKCETCGALTGGVIALGWLFGRTEPGTDKQDVYAFATEFRNKFLDSFGSTQCKAILAAFGKQEDLLECKRMTGSAAGILFDILQQEKNDRI